MVDNLGHGELSAGQERLLDRVANEVRDHIDEYREAGEELDRRYSYNILRKERADEIRRPVRNAYREAGRRVERISEIRPHMTRRKHRAPGRELYHPDGEWTPASRLEKAARAMIDDPGYRHVRTAANLLKARMLLLMAWLLGDPEAGDCRLASGALLTEFQAIPWEFEPGSTPISLLMLPESLEGKAALKKFGNCRLGVRANALEAEDQWGNDPKWVAAVTEALEFVNGARGLATPHPSFAPDATTSTQPQPAAVADRVDLNVQPRDSNPNAPEQSESMTPPLNAEPRIKHAREALPGEVLSKKARALAALTDHPDWTDEQIAQAAGCHVKSLYRWKEFRLARELLKGGREEFPRGSKDGESGELEAWDEDEPLDDDE